jgi:hypothetical protein
MNRPVDGRAHVRQVDRCCEQHVRQQVVCCCCELSRLVVEHVDGRTRRSPLLRCISSRTSLPGTRTPPTSTRRDTLRNILLTIFSEFFLCRVGCMLRGMRAPEDARACSTETLFKYSNFSGRLRRPGKFFNPALIKATVHYRAVN